MRQKLFILLMFTLAFSLSVGAVLTNRVDVFCSSWILLVAIIYLAVNSRHKGKYNE